MKCGVCKKKLEQPGDYCLECDTRNCESVYVKTKDKSAEVTFLDTNSVHGKTTLNWIENGESKNERVLERNFVGRIVDIVRRKKPEYVYINADSSRIRAFRSHLPNAEIFIFKPESNPIEDIQNHMSTKGLETVEKNPSDKLGGSHTTVIGGRDGESVIMSIASCSFVKKVIPGPIDGGGNSGGGFRSELTRSDSSGNIKVLIKEGGTVQAIRVVTTAQDRDSASIVEERVEKLIAN